MFVHSDGVLLDMIRMSFCGICFGSRWYERNKGIDLVLIFNTVW